MAVHISSHKRASAAMSASPLELGDFLCELPALLETPEQIIGMALQFLGDPKDLSEINKQSVSYGMKMFPS